MTSKEAIKYAKENILAYTSEMAEFKALAIEALERWNLADQYKWERDIAVEQLEEIGCVFGQKMDKVKETVEKADKYRWHDLRKNPDDLPKADGNNESEYVLAAIGTPEWNHYEWAYYNHSTRMWSTSLYEQNVCAWRDVEPFKGDDADDN